MLLLIILCTFVLFGWIKHEIKKVETAKNATFADCDADEQLLNWCIANPGKYMADFQEGRLVLERKISTYKTFLETHQFIDRKNHLEFLQKLLCTHNPNSCPDNKKWDNKL